MPIDSAIVGAASKPVMSVIDSRWLMAYAAGLGEEAACYFDTRRAGGVAAHPMFPVSFEWPAITGIFRDVRNLGITPDEASRGVHATHDLMIHRPIRPGDKLTTVSTVIGIERRKPGAYLLSRTETLDASGAPVCTTFYGTLYRGVAVAGSDHRYSDYSPAPPPLNRPSRPTGDSDTEIKIAVPAGAAHVYTECARIWNPIHTDAGVAERAGLPAIILHGTATLAMSVSRIVEREAGGDPTRVARIAARFGAMVMMPSSLTLRILGREADQDGDIVLFETLNAEGGLAIREGVAVIRSQA